MIKKIGRRFASSNEPEANTQDPGWYDGHPEEECDDCEAHHNRALFGRRTFIGGSAAAIGVGMMSAFALWPDSVRAQNPGATALPNGATLTPLSGPVPGTTWSQRYGADAGDVVVTEDIVLDADARVRSLRIEANARLVMAPDRSITLVSTGNVIVMGDLVMQPQSPAQIHTLRFEGVDESKYKGGGMDIFPSDVGLWVFNQGRLAGNGAPKTPWTRANGALAAGGTTIEVADANGWQPGDRIAVTPTGAPSLDTGKFHQDNANATTYDEATIVSVNGSSITIDTPLVHAHPTVTFTTWDGRPTTLGAEVLNLTRNVVISGTEEGRAHVLFLHAQQPQMLSSVQFDLLGPRREFSNNRKKKNKKQGGNVSRSEGLPGRYPFHMHHCYEGSRGSVIKDCLVTRSGNRAFVPHESHGVTLDGCVAHDVHGTAYWWDQPGRHNPTGEKPKTHDSLWTGCVASKVWADTQSEDKYRLAGFNLTEGNALSNILVDSVAVGVYTDRVSDNNGKPSGFHWPEHGHATWVFKGCLAHNIAGSGASSWQNDEEVHLLEDFTAYHCGGYGIEHGAYSNFYSYQGGTLVANRLGGIASHAVTRRTNSVRRRWTDKGEQAPFLRFADIRIEGQGITPVGLRSPTHKFAANQPDGATLFERLTVTGCTRSSLYERDMRNASYYVMTDCNLDGRAFEIDPKAARNLRIDVYNLNGSGESFTLRPGKGSGTRVEEWNATKSAIGA